jgi:transposase
VKNLTYSERRYLIIKHLKQGYTYKEACKIVEDEYDRISISNVKQRSECAKKKAITHDDFKREWNKLVCPQTR